MSEENLPAPVDVDMVAAALRQDTADLDTYARVLSTSLADSLPPVAVRLERGRRSMADRMAGRDPGVVRVDVSLGDERLALALERGRVIGEICKEVRGVVLSRRQVELDEWLYTLAEAMASAASSNARARDALRRFVTGM
jgi:hypothetical protein